MSPESSIFLGYQSRRSKATVFSTLLLAYGCCAAILASNFLAQVVRAAAGYNDELIWDLSTPGQGFFCHDARRGDSFSLGTYTDATVLDLYLRTPKGDLWITGDGTYNPDGIAHARLEQKDEHTVRLGFEDLAGGGDLDYDDCLVDLIITPR